MNATLECLRAIARYWRKNGTKVLGSIGAFVASLQAAALVMNQDPTNLVIPVKWCILLAGLNVFLSTWTVKRGFHNTKTQERAPDAVA